METNESLMKKEILNVEIISHFLKNSIDEAEKQIGCKIVFGAVGGSYSLGLQNRSSDIDFYLIVDNDKLFGVLHQKMNIVVQGEEKTIDMMCVSYQEILREIEIYKNIPKQYPTVMHRTEEEKRKHISKGDTERPDFIRSVLFRVLLSDEIINREWTENRYREFKDGLRIVDIIDYQYTRIYGNYNEKIRNMDLVPIRKYLYVIHQICTCRCLMYCTQKPPMNFIEIVNRAVSDILLKDKIFSLYEKNRNSVRDKSIELADKDEAINHFILQSVEKIRIYLEKSVHDEHFLHFGEKEFIV